jgi:hypothetical protein
MSRVCIACVAITGFRAGVFYHSRSKSPPPLDDSGFPLIRTSGRLGLPSNVINGTNCHLPLTERYCLRLALWLPMTIRYDSCLPDLNGLCMNGFSEGTEDGSIVTWMAGPSQSRKRLIIKGGSSSVAERQLPKLNVAGSIPVSRSIKSISYRQ